MILTFMALRLYSHQLFSLRKKHMAIRTIFSASLIVAMLKNTRKLFLTCIISEIGNATEFIFLTVFC